MKNAYGHFGQAFRAGGVEFVTIPLFKVVWRTSTYAFKAKMCKMQDSEMPFESFMSGWFEKKQAHANFLLDLFFNFSSDMPDVACAGSIFPLQ